MSNSSATPFCQCFARRRIILRHEIVCTCKEDEDLSWKWEGKGHDGDVVISDDARDVVFHPVYSAGTSLIRGDTPFMPDHQHYWEVRMISEVYGTDIMVGVGTSSVSLREDGKFVSLLGADDDSYGLSYMGKIHHGGSIAGSSPGFCRGSLIGVAVDTWRGTLRFYINRKPTGVQFDLLRRHGPLYPMLSSTAAQSRFRLVCAARRPVSLLTAAASLVPRSLTSSLPPGLRRLLRTAYYKHFAIENCFTSEDEVEGEQQEAIEPMDTQFASWRLDNTFYVDSVDRQYRLVVRN